MSNFTLTFCDPPAETNRQGRPLDRFGRLVTALTIEQYEKDRARIEKAATYLGPWCSGCGKRGSNCRDRYKCNIRAINRSKVPAIGASEQARRYAAAVAAARADAMRAAERAA